MMMNEVTSILFLNHNLLNVSNLGIDSIKTKSCHYNWVFPVFISRVGTTIKNSNFVLVAFM